MSIKTRRSHAKRTPKASRGSRRDSPASATTAATNANPVTARPVVIATDGSRLAGSAIRITRLMADSGQWAPDVMTVIEPLPVSVADMTLGAPSIAYQQSLTDGLLPRIHQQLVRGGGKDWKFTVQFGRVAPVIARF